MKRITLTFTLFLVSVAATLLHAQISAFTYQGRLELNGTPANGSYDFMFRLLNDPTNGAAAPVIQINPAVSITNGLFTTGMDFGVENLNGANRWLEINVRTNGGGPFTTLSPRQLLTPTPYAVAAQTASNLLGALPGSQISGTIPNASLPTSPSFSGIVTANNFAGNGGSLTNINAATLGGLNSSNFWSTTGNTGTAAGIHFLGTTDNQPVEIKVNGLRALRLEFAGDSDDPGTAPDGAPNVVGGSPANFVGAGTVGATISGGGATNLFTLAYSNSVLANFGTIAGGRGNQIEPAAQDSTISGGDQNRIGNNSQESTIGGGELNTIETNSYATVISGGYQNSIGTFANYSTIGGGYGNAIIGSVHNATINGGHLNFIRDNASDATIGGGRGNDIEMFASDATISGGLGNRIRFNTKSGAVSGGFANTIERLADYAVVGGGERNLIGTNADHSVISGGRENTVESSTVGATISGGSYNFLAGGAGTIGGGRFNFGGLGADFAVIGGGYENRIGNQATSDTIAGGYANTIQDAAIECTIGGGGFNTIGAGAFRATITGGYLNEVGTNSSLGSVGGWQNTIGPSSQSGAIGGGTGNRVGANSSSSAIGGGWWNGTGPFSDSSAIGGGKANLTASNSICATIPGGESNFATNYAFAAGRSAKAYQMGAFVWGDSTEADIASTSANSVTMRASGGYRLFTDSTATTGAFLAAGSGSWTSMSDRNAKENFHAADTREVLAKVAALPVQTWNYKSQGANIRHIGPMAQDFKAAFDIGESDTGISNVDADGVALAAIQGLNQKLEETRAENAELKQRLKELESVVQKLVAQVPQL